MRLDPNRKEHIFEIFGLDFMIDENFKPYLIEINTNPALETACPICLRVIPPMIDNAFRIAIDPLFPSPSVWPNKIKHMAPDNILENNRFELIFDEVLDGPELMKLYKGTKNYLDGIKEMEEEEELSSDEEDKDDALNNDN